jgi:hypothetical protein
LPLHPSKRRRHGRPSTGTRSTSTPYKRRAPALKYFTPTSCSHPSDPPQHLSLLN